MRCRPLVPRDFTQREGRLYQGVKLAIDILPALKGEAFSLTFRKLASSFEKTMSPPTTPGWAQ